MINVILFSKQHHGTISSSVFQTKYISKSRREVIEGGYIYGKHRRIGETTHWLCVQRGLCKAIVHTQGFEIVKRTNQHLHPPDEKAISCSEVKINIKRKEKGSQDSSHYIVGECVQTVNEGIAAKLPKLDSLKRTIERQRVLTAPVQPTTLEQLIIPEEFMRRSKDELFSYMIQIQRSRGY